MIRSYDTELALALRGFPPSSSPRPSHPTDDGYGHDICIPSPIQVPRKSRSCLFHPREAPEFCSEKSQNKKLESELFQTDGIQALSHLLFEGYPNPCIVVWFSV